MLGDRWKALSETDRKPYDEKAATDKKRYEEQKAQYQEVSRLFLEFLRTIPIPNLIS